MNESQIASAAKKAGIRRINFGTADKPEIVFIGTEAALIAFVEAVRKKPERT